MPAASDTVGEIPHSRIDSGKSENHSWLGAPVRGEASAVCGAQILPRNGGTNIGDIRVDQLCSGADLHAPKGRCRFEHDENATGITVEVA